MTKEYNKFWKRFPGKAINIFSGKELEKFKSEFKGETLFFSFQGLIKFLVDKDRGEYPDKVCSRNDEFVLMWLTYFLAEATILPLIIFSRLTSDHPKTEMLDLMFAYNQDPDDSEKVEVRVGFVSTKSGDWKQWFALKLEQKAANISLTGSKQAIENVSKLIEDSNILKELDLFQHTSLFLQALEGITANWVKRPPLDIFPPLWMWVLGLKKNHPEEYREMVSEVGADGYFSIPSYDKPVYVNFKCLSKYMDEKEESLFEILDELTEALKENQKKSKK